MERHVQQKTPRGKNFFQRFCPESQVQTPTAHGWIDATSWNSHSWNDGSEIRLTHNHRLDVEIPVVNKGIFYHIKWWFARVLPPKSIEAIRFISIPNLPMLDFFQRILRGPARLMRFTMRSPIACRPRQISWHNRSFCMRPGVVERRLGEKNHHGTVP